MGRRAPRPASLAIHAALERSAPLGGLAAAQTVWSAVVGEAVAAATEPVAERGGVLTVRCQSATWAEELSLMEGELLERLRARLGERSPRALKLLAG